MANIKVYNMKKDETGEIELNDDLFMMEYNEPLIHQAVVTRLANERQGTKSTLTRTEVRGGGKKPFRQKGTGNAREGSSRSPQYYKGGVVFAPKSRDFSMKMNVTARRTAMFSALSAKLADGEFFVLDEIVADTGKTKEMTAFLKAFDFEKTVLLVMCNHDDKVIRAARNIRKLRTISVEQLNTYDIVANSVIVLAKGSVEKLQEGYGA